MKRLLACFAALAPLAQNPAPTEDVRWLALADQAWRISEPRVVLPEAREVLHADDGASTFVVRGGPWHPEQGRQAELFVIAWEEGRAARVIALMNEELLVDAAWSADGSLAGAILRKPNGAERLVTVDLATGRTAASAISPAARLMSGGPGALLIITFGPELDPIWSIVSRSRQEVVHFAELNRLLQGPWRMTGDVDGLGRPLLESSGNTLAIDAGSMGPAEPAPAGPPIPKNGILDIHLSRDGDAVIEAKSPPGAPMPAASNPLQPIIPRTVVSRDAAWAAMAAGDQAAYISDGVLFARRIQASSYDDFLLVHKAAMRDRAIKQAKQAGLALMMLAADSDDQLPFGDVSGKLMPYMKDRDILNAVSWTNVNGQFISRMQNAAETELGYLGTPFGDAVIFADGHVVWRPRP